MKKRKKNPATIGLGSAQVDGQGTTQTETGRKSISSTRKTQKRD